MGWSVLYEAPDQTVGESIVATLREHGLNSRIHPGDNVSFLGVSMTAVRIQVAEKDAPRAQQVLEDLLS